jgi:hypothetical protein
VHRQGQRLSRPDLGCGPLDGAHVCVRADRHTPFRDALRPEEYARLTTTLDGLLADAEGPVRIAAIRARRKAAREKAAAPPPADEATIEGPPL